MRACAPSSIGRMCALMILLHEKIRDADAMIKRRPHFSEIKCVNGSDGAVGAVYTRIEDR